MSSLYAVRLARLLKLDTLLYLLYYELLVRVNTVWHVVNVFSDPIFVDQFVKFLTHDNL